jgi:apolipoprotein N-acyltransferase
VMMASVVAAFAYGVHVLEHPIDLPPASGGATVPLRIAAVQPDIPESFKSDAAHVQEIYDRYDALTHTALAWQPQLLLWPEAATLTDLFDADTFAWLKEIGASTDAAFILGSFLSPPGEGDYNIAACLTRHGQKVQVYRKMHLVPFGEYIPARHSFPLFAKIAGQLVPGDLRAGTEYTLFDIDSPAIRIAPLICFEDTVGDQTRRMASRGAQLLVNITNDSWFGTLRDQNGSTFFEGILFGTVYVPRDPPTTLYMRYGDWVAVGSVAVAFAAIGWRLMGLIGRIGLMRRIPGLRK